MQTQTFEQSTLLGINQLEGSSRTPSLFIEFPLKFDSYIDPQLELVLGNTSNMLRSALTLITGRLGVSHLYQKAVSRYASGVEYNNRLLNIATGPGQIDFKEETNQNVLRSDGQVVTGSLYKLQAESNGNILARSTAFVDAFFGISDDRLKLWGNVTGLKTIDPQNTKHALEILEFFYRNPTGTFPVYNGEGVAKETNPKYEALKKMRQNNLVQFVPNPNIQVHNRNNALFSPMVACVPDEFQETIMEYGHRIEVFKVRYAQYIQKGFEIFFDTNEERMKPTKSESHRYGISLERMRAIGESLALYNKLSSSPS